MTIENRNKILGGAILVLIAITGLVLVLKSPFRQAPEDVKVDFLSKSQSTGELKVLMTSPSGENVPIANDGITVTFDQAMVPLTTLDKGRDLSVPFTVTPPTPGRFFWLGTKSFIFRPEKSWTPSTSYKVSLPAGLTARNGHKLDKPVEWTFSTVAPEVKSFQPADGESLLPKEAGVRLLFNVAMKTEDVEKALVVRLPSTGQPVTAAKKFVWHKDGHELEIVFTEELPWNETVEVTVPAGVHGAVGEIALQKAQTVRYKTPAREITVKSVFSPGDGKRVVLSPGVQALLPAAWGVCYEFSQPILGKSFEAAFHAAAPGASKLPQPYFYFQSSEFFAREGNGDDFREGYRVACAAIFEDHDQAYTFGIDATKIEGLAGSRLSAASPEYAVKTENAKPMLSSKLTKTVLSPKITLKIPYRSMNVARAHFRIFKLDDEANYTENVKDTVLGAATRSAADENTADPGLDAKLGYGGVSVPVHEDGLSIDESRLALWASHEIDAGAAPNQMARLTLDLAEIKSAAPLSPGYYLIEAQGTPLMANTQAPPNKYSIVQITDVALAVKRDVDKVLVWATDIATGAPLAGLSLTATLADDETVSRSLDGVTDAQGLAVFPGPWSVKRWDYSSQVCVKAVLPEKFSFTCQDFHDFGGWHDVLQPGKTFFAYLYTDRPIYRPGQTVKFSSFVREVKESRYFLADPSQTYAVNVNDASGAEIYRNDTMTAEAGGVVKGEFVIADSDDTPRGEYVLVIKAGEQIFSKTFYVRSYRKPTFKVGVTAQENEIVNGDELSAAVSGTYYFGAPLKSAPARWSIMTTTYRFAPDGFDEFEFMDADLLHRKDGSEDYDYYTDYEFDIVAGSHSSEESDRWDDPRGEQSFRGASGFLKDADNQSVSNKAAVLDDGGNLAVSYKPDLAKYPVSQILTLEASVTDPANQEVSAAGDVVVHKADFYLGIRPEKWAYGEGEDAVFEVVSLDTTGKAVPNKNFQAELIRRDYNYIKRRTSSGYWEFIYEPKDTLVTTLSGASDVSGKTRVSTKLPQGGSYRLVLKSQDARNNPVQTAGEVYAWGQGYVPWRLNEATALELVPDKSSYKVGETARVLVKSLMPVSKALVSFERGRILEHRVVELGGNASHIDIPIVEGHVPNFYVSVVAHAGQSESGSPHLFHGESEIIVEPESKRLHIALTPDRKAMGDMLAEYRPGDEVRVKVETKDSQGRPRKAHVIVSVADESVLSLLDYKLPDLVKKFYYLRSNQVKTSSSLVSLKAGDGSAQGKKRQVFQDTAHFESHLVTDDSGVGEIRFKLPDDLTTWVIEAVAVTDTRMTLKDFEDGAAPLAASEGTLVGSARAKVLATLPVLLRTALPRFAAWEDSVAGSVILNNRAPSETKGKLSVTLNGGGVFADGSKETEIPFAVAGGTEKAFPVSFKVENGASEIRLSAAAKESSGVVSDALEIRLKVLDRHAPEVVATSGLLTQQKETQQIDLPGNIVPDKGGLDVAFKASLGLAIATPMRDLISYPWGCSEQKSATLLALLMARDMSSRLGETYFDALAPIDPKEIVAVKGLEAKLKLLDVKIANLITELTTKFGHYSGGVLYWPESPKPHFEASAQVLWALTLARSLGLDAPEPFIQGLRTFVANYKPKDAVLSAEDSAYRLWVLAQSGELSAQSVAELEDVSARGELSVQGLGFVLATLVRREDSGQTILATVPVSSRRRDVAARLLTLAKHDPRHVSWEDTGHGFAASPVKNTALAAYALRQNDPSDPIVPKALAFLLNRKKAGGNFVSTQDSLYLSFFGYDYSRALAEEATDFMAKASAGEIKIVETRFNKDNLLSEQKGSVATAKLLAEDMPLDMTFSKVGSGTLYYDAVLKYYLPAKEVPTREEGLTITREYHALSDKDEKTPLTEFKVGEVYKGHITLVVPKPLNAVLVQDKLPAGFEAVDMTLATTSRADLQTIRSGYEDEFDPWREVESPRFDDVIYTQDFGMDWGFSHQEIRDDAIVWSDEFLSPGVYHIRYPVRATTAGAYLMPGAEAFEFYEPEVFGRSKTGLANIITP